MEGLVPISCDELMSIVACCKSTIENYDGKRDIITKGKRFCFKKFKYVEFDILQKPRFMYYPNANIKKLKMLEDIAYNVSCDSYLNSNDKCIFLPISLHQELYHLYYESDDFQPDIFLQ